MEKTGQEKGDEWWSEKKMTLKKILIEGGREHK